MVCFLAEWHRSAFSDPAITKFVRLLTSCTADVAEITTPVRLMMVLSVAADARVYGVFEADTAETVLRVCTRAGALPQRVTPGVDARFTEPLRSLP
jgi:hypothetical protein